MNKKVKNVLAGVLTGALGAAAFFIGREIDLTAPQGPGRIGSVKMPTVQRVDPQWSQRDQFKVCLFLTPGDNQKTCKIKVYGWEVQEDDKEWECDLMGDRKCGVKSYPLEG